MCSDRRSDAQVHFVGQSEPSSPQSYEQTIYDVTLDSLKGEYNKYTDTIIIGRRVRGQVSQATFTTTPWGP